MRYFIPLLLTVSCTTTDPTPTAEPIPKLGTKAPTAEQRAESLAIFTAVMGGLIKGFPVTIKIGHESFCVNCKKERAVSSHAQD